MDKSCLTKSFDAFNQYQVLVVGDVMVDAYAWGKVSRISPEAPVPILSCYKRDNRLGGASNVAMNIKSLGGHPTLCSVIGDDAAGKTLLELLEKRELSAEGIVVSRYRKTTVKTRFLSKHHHMIRVDEEDTHPLEAEIETEFIARALALLKTGKFHALIFQDYDKGVITKRSIDKITAFANELCIPILVDPKKRNFLDYKEVTFFKPNLKEFSEGINQEIEKQDIPQLKKAVEKFRTEQNITQVLVTLSELGVLMCAEEETVHVPADEREIADVSGAGDTVISTACMCLIAQMPPKVIATISNLAGSLVCEHPVVVSVDKSELLKESIELLG